MKVLYSLCALVMASSTFAAETADRLVLSLNDVDEQIQKVDFYTCNVQLHVISACQDRVEVTKRDGNKITKNLSWYTSSLLNDTRNSFSSDLRPITVRQRNGVCRRVPPPYATSLSAIYVNYVDHDAFAIKSVEFKTILSAEDCTRQEVTQPVSPESYSDARKAKEILTLLANELLN